MFQVKLPNTPKLQAAIDWIRLQQEIRLRVQELDEHIAAALEGDRQTVEIRLEAEVFGELLGIVLAQDVNRGVRAEVEVSVAFAVVVFDPGDRFERHVAELHGPAQETAQLRESFVSDEVVGVVERICFRDVSHDLLQGLAARKGGAVVDARSRGRIRLERSELAVEDFHDLGVDVAGASKAPSLAGAESLSEGRCLIDSRRVKVDEPVHLGGCIGGLEPELGPGTPAIEIVHIAGQIRRHDSARRA
jgi:hypothetical protein